MATEFVDYQISRENLDQWLEIIDKARQLTGGLFPEAAEDNPAVAIACSLIFNTDPDCTNNRLGLLGATLSAALLQGFPTEQRGRILERSVKVTRKLAKEYTVAESVIIHCYCLMQILLANTVVQGCAGNDEKMHEALRSAIDQLATRKAAREAGHDGSPTSEPPPAGGAGPDGPDPLSV